MPPKKRKKRIKKQKNKRYKSYSLPVGRTGGKGKHGYCSGRIFM